MIGAVALRFAGTAMRTSKAGGLLLFIVACAGCCSLIVLLLNGSQSARGDVVELEGVRRHSQLAAASQGRGRGGLTKHSRFGPRLHGSEYGRAIFERLRTGGHAGAQSQTTLPQLQQATGGDSAEVENTNEGVGEEGEGEKAEEEEEGPPKTVYVYDGREVKPDAAELTTYILAVGFEIPDVRYIKSSSEADMRCPRPSDPIFLLKTPIKLDQSLVHAYLGHTLCWDEC